MSFADLCELDGDSALQDKWIADYWARWAAQRAAASVSAGDGGAWLEGDAARRVACNAMVIPVVMGEVDPGAVQDLIGLCVQYDRLRGHAAGRPPAAQAEAESPQVVQVIPAASADGGCRIIRCSAPVSISSISQMSPCLSACCENR
jgi:hypothetical protein